MLVGLNVAISYFVGSVLAWYAVLPRASLAYSNCFRGIAGPILVSRGLAFGTPASDDPKWSALISYFSLGREFTTAEHPSPRYWLLWPGVLCMIAVSFTGKPIANDFINLLSESCRVSMPVESVLALLQSPLESSLEGSSTISIESKVVADSRARGRRGRHYQRSRLTSRLCKNVDVASGARYRPNSDLHCYASAV
jgi:hypothetical protein